MFKKHNKKGEEAKEISSWLPAEGDAADSLNIVLNDQLSQIRSLEEQESRGIYRAPSQASTNQLGPSAEELGGDIARTSTLGEAIAGKRGSQVSVALSTPADVITATVGDANDQGSFATATAGGTSAPKLSVNAENPAAVIIEVSGLSSDYSGAITFTDTTGRSDVVPIGSDGTYSANLSNLADGTLTYVMTVSDPAGNVITIDPTVTLGDGSANAPSGPAQLPNLLSGYAVRPSWMVAGVDYAAGVSSGVTLTDWENLSGPGISVNTSTHVVSIYNTSGVNISDVDFSLHGGATLMFVNSPNAVVSNCVFGGSNLTTISNAVIDADQGSGGLTVEYCTIDGGGAGSGSTLVSAGGSGTVTLEYNWFKNFPQHVLELTQGSGANFSVVYKYNLIEQGAEQTLAHLNYLQFNSGNATSVDVEFNTSYQTPQASGGEGYQFYDNSAGGSINDVTLAYNTMIASGGSAGTAMSYLIHGSGVSVAAAYSNYISDPAAWGAFYNGSVSGWSLSNNMDMTTGDFIQANNSEVSQTTVTQVLSSPSNGIEVQGAAITFTVDFSQTVTVSGTPTLSLNDGGTASYTGGSGTKALTFAYAVGGTDTSVTSLAITQINLPNGASITDGNADTPNLTGALATFSGLQVESTATVGPTMSSITESPSSGDLDAGKTVTLTLTTSEAVTVAGGTPTLTLNDGGTATYSGGSGTSTLTFSYTVASGQNTSGLTATAVNLNSSTITDGAGNAASLSLTGLTQTGPQIDTTTPTISSIAESPSTGDLDAGKTVTLTLTTSEAVTVAGGTPTLTLNDGGTATYSGGSGTSTLTFSYTVAAGQNTAALAATAINLDSATITDGAGNAASLSLSGLTQTGPQIDTTTPIVSSVVTSGSGINSGNGDLDAGKTVTLTLNLNEVVTVAGGTPTLTLNDGGTATYSGGSGTSALTFSYTVGVGQNTSDLAVTAINLNAATVTDGAGNVANLSSAVTNPAGTLQIDTTTPTISALTESPSSGDLDAGKTVTLTLTTSEAVTVAGGTPTLTLNDGGTATYSGGSSTSTLTFSYTVASGQNTSGLTATAVNLNSSTITDGAGNAASLSLTGLTQTGPQIDTTTPTISSIAESPSTGDLDAGKTVTLTLTTSEAVTVAGGTPTLTLNDGGTATYSGGSGTSTLTFSYTVAAGQSTSGLTATAVNLNSSTITDGAGNAASLSLTGLTQTGPQIDTTTPTVSSVVASGSGISSGSGDLGASKTVTLTLSLNEAVTVAGGTPTLTLNDGGTATYTGGSGTSALTFSYTVGAGQNTSDLAVTAINLNAATVSDGAGNVASLSGAVTNPAGTLQIDTTTPTISSIAESPSTGDLDAGKTVTLTLTTSEAVTVAGGTPTLTLNDGGTATYSGGSGTSTLTFGYTVAAGQNTAALAATAINLDSATITDGAGNAASLSLSGLTQTGPQIDTITPTISSIAETPSSGDLNAGKTVTYTITMNEALTVNTTGGSPTLSLNDGGTATYVSGSGTDALTFSYTVLAGQNTPDLEVSEVNLNGSALTDGAGNAANLSLTGIAQGSPQIDTTAPTISSIAETPSSGDLNAGKTVTLTVNTSEVVTVAGGTPTLTLNDGGTATYTGGSGTSTLTFSYTVGAGQNTSALAATAINLNSATITDGAGNAASLSLTGLTQTGPQIDTTASTAPVITSDKVAGHHVILSGTAQSGTTVTVYLDGTTLLGATTTNSNGAWSFSSGNLADGSYVFTATATDAAGNVSALSAPLDPVVGAGPVLSAAPINVGNQTYVYNSTGAGIALSYAGSAVTAGEFGSWITVGAAQNSSGYDVAWQNTATGQYTVWATDGNGNYVTNVIGAVAGNSSALEALEPVFDQNLNGDGQLTSTVMQTDGSTSLTAVSDQVATVYYLDNTNFSNPALQYNGADVTAGEFAGWTPIGAVQTGSGYDVAWENTSTGQYTVWSTDSNGNYTGNVVGAVAGNSYALESLEPLFQQDLNSDGTVGLTTTLIHADGSTNLTEVANQFSLYNGGGTGPALQYQGAPVVDGEFGAWVPIAAVQTATGYDVAWAIPGSNEYTVWAVNSSGQYTGNVVGAVSGTSAALASLTSVFGQSVTSDANFTSTVIQTDNATSLTSVGNQLLSVYYLDNSNGSGPALQYSGADVVPGEFYGWTPIGAVQTASGYDVAWQNTVTGQYTVWSTDSNGNYTGNVFGAVAGTSSALEALEPVFDQNLNGDGQLTTTVKQTDGSTSLTAVSDQVATVYYLANTNGSDPALQYNGADVTAGEFAGWTPIGAVQTATGYDVAWQNTDGQYTVWSTNSSGQYTGNVIGAVSANSTALEQLEPVFGQDLNGDGTTGLTTTVIKTDGSTSLTQVANQYDLDNSGTGTGPALQYSGADVTTGEFAGWTPIGAVQTASGYDVAWQNTDGQYTVWSTNSSGQYTGNVIGAVSANSTALEQLEPVFGQDLNGDGVVGLYAAPATTLQISSALSGATGAATIGAGATLALAGADSAAVTFAASTGELVLSNPSTFTGEISGFTGNGTLAGSDQIDLKGLSDSGLTDSYSNGVLTLTSGGQTDKLDFNGSYVLANFSFASDGSGGTIVYDPPVASSSSSANPATGTNQQQTGLRSVETRQVLAMDVFSEPPTLGCGSTSALSTKGNSHPDNLALFGSYIASSFPTGSGSSPAVPSVAWENSHPSLLTSPHHA